MFILCQECVLHYIIILIRISVGIYKEFKKKNKRYFQKCFIMQALVFAHAFHILLIPDAKERRKKIIENQRRLL